MLTFGKASDMNEMNFSERACYLVEMGDSSTGCSGEAEIAADSSALARTEERAFRNDRTSVAGAVGEHLNERRASCGRRVRRGIRAHWKTNAEQTMDAYDGPVVRVEKEGTRRRTLAENRSRSVGDKYTPETTQGHGGLHIRSRGEDLQSVRRLLR